MLVKVRRASSGGTQPRLISRQEITIRQQKLGLTTCPLEVRPCVRLQTLLCPSDRVCIPLGRLALGTVLGPAFITC